MKKIFKSIFATASIACLCGTASVLGVDTYNAVIANADSIGTYSVGLNMSEYDLRDNGVETPNGEKYLYLAIEDGDAIPYSADWSVAYGSDTAVKVNGVATTARMIKTDAERVAFPLKNSEVDFGNLQVGSTITIDGTFTNAEKGSFVVEESTFIYDGYTWIEEDTVTYALEYSAQENGAPQNGMPQPQSVREDRVPVLW